MRACWTPTARCCTSDRAATGPDENRKAGRNSLKISRSKAMDMSRFSSRFVVAAALAAAYAAPACAQSYRVGALVVTEPWIRATPPGAVTAGGYLTITNRGATPDRLLSVDTPAAGHVEMHQMSMTGGIMRMRPIAGGLAIAPGQSVVLTPSGERHLMLVDPKHALRLGEHIPAVLHFAKAGAVRISFTVRAIDARMTPPMQPMAGRPMAMP